MSKVVRLNDSILEDANKALEYIRSKYDKLPYYRDDMFDELSAISIALMEFLENHDIE